MQLIALAIALVGGAFKLMHWAGANMLLIVGMGTLVIYYLVSAFIPPSRSPKAVMVNYTRNFSIALLICGLLFYLMRWPGANHMLIAGVASVVLSFVLQISSGGKTDE